MSTMISQAATSELPGDRPFLIARKLQQRQGKALELIHELHRNVPKTAISLNEEQGV
jgi:hypothetical protein